MLQSDRICVIIKAVQYNIRRLTGVHMKKFASCIISVIINLMLFFTSLYFMVMSVAMTDYWEYYPVYVPQFIMCIAFMLIAFALPFGANFLLYRFWYKKAGMSKLWIVIPLLGTYLILLFCLLVFLMSIPDWGNFTWQVQ